MSVESPWPAVNGGRARVSNVVEQLAASYDVTVIYPVKAGEPASYAPPGVKQIAVDTATEPRLRDRLSILPRLGIITLRTIAPELKIVMDQLRPDFVYWTHSYIAAVGMKSNRDGLNLVEFANIEGKRSLSLGRSSKRIRNRVSAFSEYLKSLWWEPRCARRASLTISLHHQEAKILQASGAKVVLAQNGFSQHEYFPSSPDSRRILAVGSWTYGPNRSAIESFLEGEWVEILRQAPTMELVIAGSGSEGLLDGRVSKVQQVSALGFVDDLSQIFRDSFCLLAPATSGGGSQLKIAEALSHHRPVIGPAFLAREVSPEMPEGVLIASDDIVSSVIELAQSPSHRHLLERKLLAFVADRTWHRNFLPVRTWLTETLRENRPL
ncbi:glycosyltransferase [Arthrobacter sp. FW306-2-2C-D06B]|uniref:glycosyltransferase n=1 Tax=Arthrobacter sp. FW306-2-2C-D06B TaxID=2879618 RepID=UPI001F2A0D3C|nr:glycosyltransferase [Arthrobacter sp. FW306-2-2C-D06B]UKA57993.1 glycosyltransferase [Arthrobacter sp. FW306-2-2C-D06B]